MQQPTFVVPSTESFQRLESVKQQIEELERSIASSNAKGEEATQSTKDSLAFLKAQHDSLSLWQRSMIAQSFPPGLVFVAPGGQAFYHTRLPDGTGMQEGVGARSAQVHIPSVPTITPIKTLSYPTRRSTRPKKSETEVTVTIKTRGAVVEHRPRPRKDSKPGPNPFQEAMVRTQIAPPRPVPTGRVVNGNTVIDERDDCVRINGIQYSPGAFRWWTDPNGEKHFVYIPFMMWDDEHQRWAMRVVLSAPNACTMFFGSDRDPCFEVVRSLQKLVDPLLGHLWYVKVC